MKSSTAMELGSRYAYCRRTGAARCPNAAARRYFLERFVNAALAAALTLAIVTVFLFLMVLR